MPLLWLLLLIAVGTPSAALTPAPAVAPTRLPRTAALFTSSVAAPSVLPAVFGARLLLHADVDGHMLWFHLDTGSPSLYISAAEAKSIGLSVDPATRYCEPVPVKIGTVGATLRFQTLDSYGLESEDRQISGIIGGPFFHANVVTIDFPNKTVTFYPPGTFVPPANVAPTPIEISNNTPVVTASFGGVQGRFLIDTGSSITELSAAFARKIRLGFYRGDVTTASGGERNEAVYDSPDITFAGSVLHGIEVAVADPPRVSDDGLIGRYILSNYSVTFDYANRLAYFVPKP